MEVAIIVESCIASQVDYPVVASGTIVASCTSSVIAAGNSPGSVSFLPCVIVAVKNSVNVPTLLQRLAELFRILNPHLSQVISEK
jgi:hypothetical protein